MSDPLYLTGELSDDKGKHYKIYYFTERGKERLDKLFQALDVRCDAIQRRAYEIEKIQRLLVSIPHAKKFIIKFLDVFPESTTSGVFVMINWNTDEANFRVPFYYAWDELVKEKEIIPTSHGRGHPRTWSLAKP